MSFTKPSSFARRAAGLFAGTALLSAGAVLVAPGVASAAVTATANLGTGVVTVNATGNTTVSFDCASGALHVSSNPTSPSIACSAVTRVNVTGDNGNQNVYANGLGASNFTSHPFVDASLGDGNDVVGETPGADIINLGPGGDTLYLYAGGATNVLNALGGAGEDNTVYVDGSSLPDVMTLSSTNGTMAFAITNSSGTVSQSVNGTDYAYVYGEAGNDTINANAVTAASSIADLALNGDAGTNSMSSTAHAATFYSEVGATDTFTGGPATDTFWSYSDTDTIHSGGGADVVYDYSSPSIGGRAFDGAGPATWYTQLNGGDVVARVRPGPTAGTSRITASLLRSSTLVMPAGVTRISANFNYSGEHEDVGLADVVVPGTQGTSVNGDEFADDLLDVTVPSGSWTVVGNSANGGVQTADPNLGDVSWSKMGSESVHGPWTDKAAGFAHRVTRDLVFRFLSDSDRTALRNQLVGGTKTRAQVVHGLIFSDEYRGLDVDRIFRRFLKREPDAGGRDYWISALRNGKSLRKFRAQLFGSNEYYTKAGSSASGFVTAAYHDVLGRYPDAGGLSYWVNKINGGTPRGSVANYFLGSTEARRSIIKTQFLRFLDRTPIQAEIDQWMGPLDTSATGEQDLIAYLAGSGSYYNRT